MATTETDRVSVEELIRVADQLPYPELDDLVSRLLNLRAKRRAPCLAKEESELMERINEGLPTDVWERYHELDAKREAETLTVEEHRELIDLSDRVEQRQVERLELLSKLAEIRNTTLDALMDELGLRARDNG